MGWETRKIKGRVLRVISIFGFVVSAHGFYAWMHKNDWQLAVDVASGKVQQGDLFFRFTIPIVDKIIAWMSYESVHSILMPVVVGVVSFLLWRHRWG